MTLSVVTFFLLAIHFRVNRVRSQPDLLLCFVAGDGTGSEFVSQFIAHYYCFFYFAENYHHLFRKYSKFFIIQLNLSTTWLKTRVNVWTVCQNSGRCREVAVSGASTVSLSSKLFSIIDFFLVHDGPACVRTNMRESVVFTWPFAHSGVLTRLKIVCLENEKREAKKKYVDSQKMYVKEMLGRPMEKLSVSWSPP